MVGSLKKMYVVVLCAVVMIAACACKPKEAASKADTSADKAPITSEWVFDHAVSNGKYVSRLASSKEEDANIPHFKTDGKTFTFNLTEKNTYTGTVEDNGDGTYSLVKSADKPKLKVTIEGNALTVHVSDASNVVFVVKK